MNQVEDIIRKHVIWAAGAGMVPVPLMDLVAVTAIQGDMLKQLAKSFGVDYSESKGKMWVSGLTGSILARIGANALKLIPGLGSVLGGISMAAMSGASTYAMGRVAAQHFAKGGTFSNLDMDAAKKQYDEEFEKGKQYTKEATAKGDESKEVFEKLEKLGQLHEKGVLSAEEFDAQKKKLLERI